MSAELERMDADTARALTDQIRTAALMTWELIRQAYEQRAWEALGYGSWDQYTRSEFADVRLRLPAENQRETVLSLQEAGMTLREIAAVTHESKSSIGRVLTPPPVPPGTDVDVPEPISVHAEIRRVPMEPVDGLMPDGRSPGAITSHNQNKALLDLIQSVPDEHRPPIRARIIAECDHGEQWPTRMTNREWHEIHPVIVQMVEEVEALLEVSGGPPLPQQGVPTGSGDGARRSPASQAVERGASASPAPAERSDIPRGPRPKKPAPAPTKDEMRAPALADAAAARQFLQVWGESGGNHAWDQSLYHLTLAEQDEYRDLFEQVREIASLVCLSIAPKKVAS